MYGSISDPFMSATDAGALVAVFVLEFSGRVVSAGELASSHTATLSP